MGGLPYTAHVCMVQVLLVLVLESPTAVVYEVKPLLECTVIEVSALVVSHNYLGKPEAMYITYYPTLI